MATAAAHSTPTPGNSRRRTAATGMSASIAPATAPAAGRARLAHKVIESTDGHEPRRMGQRVGVIDPHSLPLLPVEAGVVTGRSGRIFLHLARVGVDYQRRAVDGLEVAATNAVLELVQVVVVPTLVRNTGEEPISPVVCQDHAVGLERGQDHPVGVRKSRDVEGGLETEALSHGRYVRVMGRPRFVARRPDV